MLKLLLKKQLTEIFRNYFYDPKKNKARSKGAVILYFVLFGVLMVGVLGGLFTFLSLALCTALYNVGMPWLYFLLIGLLASFLGIFGSVFNTYAGLYLPKDNDLLLSLDPRSVHTDLSSSDGLSFGASLLGNRLSSRLYRLLRCDAVQCFCGSRFDSSSLPDHDFCADAFLRARMGRCQDQHKVKEQELSHRSFVGSFLRRVLFLLF